MKSKDYAIKYVVVLCLFVVLMSSEFGGVNAQSSFRSYSYQIRSQLNNIVLDRKNTYRPNIHVDTSPLIYPIPKSIYNFNTENSSNMDGYVLSSTAVDVKIYLRDEVSHHEPVYKKLFDAVKLPKTLPRDVYANLNLNVLGLNAVHVHVVEHEHISHLQRKHSEYWLIIDKMNSNANSTGQEASVTIVAYDITGVNYGFQSLLQILEQHAPSSKSIAVPISCIKSFPLVVHDYGDYKWRGFMVDVSRHYIPLHMLKRSVVGMQASKLNVMHLHLSDAQAFPVLFSGLEASKLASCGAHGFQSDSCNSTKSFRSSQDQVYTTKELKELVAYAHVRGIVVIPEIDMPAHAGSWRFAYPQYVVNCPTTAGRAEHPADILALNPVPLIEAYENEMKGSTASNNTHPQHSLLSLIRILMKQLTKTFHTSPYLHIGGDEVNLKCWAEDTTVMNWARNRSMSMSDVLKKFEEVVTNEVYKLGKTPIFWQESFDTGSIPSDLNLEDKALQFDKHISGDVNMFHPFSTAGSTGKPVIQPWKCWGGLAPSCAAKAASTTHYNSTRRIIDSFETYFSNAFQSGATSTVDTTSISEIDLNNSTASVNNELMDLYRSNIRYLIRTDSFPIVNAACDYLDFNSDVYELHTDEDTIGVAIGRAADAIWREVSRDRSIAEDRFEAAQKRALQVSRTNCSDCDIVDDLEISHALLELIEERVDRIETTHGRRLSGRNTKEPVGIDVVQLQSFIKDTLLDLVFHGGEGAMWTESVDYTNFECRVWPRMGIIANKYWNRMHAPSIVMKSFARAPGNKYPLHAAVIGQYITKNGGVDGIEVGEDSLEGYLYRLGYVDVAADTSRTVSTCRYELSKYTLKAYTRYRYFLLEHLAIQAARITLHTTPIDTNKLQANDNDNSSPYVTVDGPWHVFSKDATTSPALNSEYDILSKIDSNDAVVSLAERRKSRPEHTYYVNMKSQSANKDSVELLIVTSQCLGLPRDVVREIPTESFLLPTPTDSEWKPESASKGADTSSKMSFLGIQQFNTENGSPGEKLTAMKQWLKNKGVGNASHMNGDINLGLAVAGFCELNSWHTLESDTSISRNMDLMQRNSADSGFAYSHILGVHNTAYHPYNIGIMSIYPFQILGEYGPKEGFQRGLLHVYINMLKLHVCITHLHAHSSSAREVESNLIVDILKPYLTRKHPEYSDRVVLMGDMNTLSPWDKQLHAEENIVSSFQRKDHSVFLRMKRKYLTEDGSKVNYTPMKTLLDAGFLDTCAEFCVNQLHQQGFYPKDISFNNQDLQWSLKKKHSAHNINTIFSLCMRKHCPYTEPTLHNPEWPSKELKDHLPHPNIRLDYILATKSVLYNVQNIEGKNSSLVPALKSVFVEINDHTDTLSDHYPISIQLYV